MAQSVITISEAGRWHNTSVSHHLGVPLQEVWIGVGQGEGVGQETKLASCCHASPPAVCLFWDAAAPPLQTPANAGRLVSPQLLFSSPHTSPPHNPTLLFPPHVPPHPTPFIPLPSTPAPLPLPLTSGPCGR